MPKGVAYDYTQGQLLFAAYKTEARPGDDQGDCGEELEHGCCHLTKVRS